MQRLLANHRFTDTDRALRFLVIRLGSRPETAALAPEVSGARARLRETEERYQEALQARVGASAEIEYLDGLLDEAVMNLSREALALMRGDRTDARYQKLFSAPPSAAMSPVGGDAQDGYVRNILSRLDEDADLASLRAHKDELGARRDALLAAAEKRRSLAVPEAKSDADRRQALDDAKRLYNRSESQLNLLLGDKALLETYFLTLKRTKAEAEAGEE